MAITRPPPQSPPPTTHLRCAACHQDKLNNMLHWLPTHVLQTLPPTTFVDSPSSVPFLPNATAFDDTASFHFDDKNSYSHDNDDRSAPALPTMSSITSMVPCPPSTKIISFPCPPPSTLTYARFTHRMYMASSVEHETQKGASSPTASGTPPNWNTLFIGCELTIWMHGSSRKHG